MNYIFSRFQDKQNPDRQGYILSKNNKELETLFYDIDKISHLELVQKKKDFFNFICSKYQDVDRRTLLLIFAYEDELIFVEVALAKYRDRLGYKVYFCRLIHH